MSTKVQNISLQKVKEISTAWDNQYPVGKKVSFPLAWHYETKIWFQPIPRHCKVAKDVIISVPGYAPDRIPNTYDCMAYIRAKCPQYFPKFESEQNQRLASLDRTFEKIDYHCQK